MKRYFTKSKTLSADEAGGLGGAIFIFAPKVVTKIGMNHAEAGVGLYTNKDHKLIISKYVKLFSADNKPTGADKIRKWFCK
jgi:hypothetical protein